jgi:hypothetical protein
MSREKAVQNIKTITGLESDRDAESLLQTAVRNGDLTTTNRTVFEVGIPGDMTAPAVRRYVSREAAENAAARLGLEVRERTHQDVAIPGTAAQLPGGPDIRQGTFKQGVAPAGFEIRSPDAVLQTAPSQEEADAKADRLQQLRAQKANGYLGEIAKKEAEMAKSQRKLESMEADGKADTLEYKKIAAGVAAQNKRLQNEINALKAKVQNYTAPLEIAPKGEKPVTRDGFTLFEQGQPVATFPSQQAAEEAALLRLPDETLQQIANLAPSQKGLMPKRLGKMAEAELRRRRGEQPAGFGVEFTGDKAAAEARLAEAGVFTPEFQKAADELAKKLRPMMERLGLGDLRLNILKAIKTKDGQTADGYYLQKVIAIAMDADNPIRTLRHEGIHALKELGAFTPEQWRVLENKAKSEWMAKYDIANRYRGMGMSQADMIEEAIADAFSDFDQTKAPPGMIGALFNKIRQFLDAFGNGLRGMGFQSAEGIFTRVGAGEMKIDKNLLRYEPLAVRGEVADETGRRYALLQHASRADFDKLQESQLGAFAFGYGAYSSVTKGLDKKQIGKRDVTETSQVYGKPYSGKGYIYLADMPMSKENTLILDKPLTEQPAMLQKFIEAGIVEPSGEGRASETIRFTPYYGGKSIYNLMPASTILYEMQERYAQDMLESGYPLTGLMGEKKPSGGGFADPYGLQKRIASELDRMGIEVSVLSRGMNDPYAIVHNPQRFNERLVGKYEMDNKGNIKTVSGRPVQEQSLIEKIKDRLPPFRKKARGDEFQVRYEDLPDRAKYQLPRVMSSGKIVGAPPGMSTEADRTRLVEQMTNLLSHPYSLYDESKNWYEDSGRAIMEITRGDPVLTERVVRLMALYSQANGVGGNTTATISSIAQMAAGEPTAFAGRFPNTTAARIPALLAAPTMDTSVPGVDDKLMNFYRNLHDATYGVDTFQDASTIDRWMMRLFGYPHAEDQEAGGASSVSNTQYTYAKDLIRRIGEANMARTGEALKPRQVQAILWTYVKNTTDYNSLTPEKQATFEPSIVDFSDYITRATANITWESRPSTKLPLIPGIHKASRAEQEAFNRAVRAIFIDPETGVDKIFELLGNQQLYSSQFSIGAYENLIAPNVITKLVMQKDDGDYLTDVANKYAAIIGYVTKQDAVPWYRADPTAGGKDASKGYRVTATNAEANPGFEERLFKHLNEKIPGIGFTRVGNSFDFINFRDTDTGKPYMMSDKQYLDKLQGALESFDKAVDFDVEPFRAKSGWISNDWTENTNGQGYLERFSPAELTNLRRYIEGWSADYERIADQFGQEYGWSDPRKFSLRPSTEGDGISLGTRQPGAVTVDAVHYGKEKVDTLLGGKYGTGIRGAEARRLADAFDPRIKNRVYFYIPKEDGKMPLPESGLGGHVYIQRFNNILGPGPEMGRISREAFGDSNNFESGVIDAGYDGYAIPSMGMMVILNNDTPVEYRGTRDEVSRKPEEQTVQIGDRRYALRQTDTPEFKKWFGKSKIVAERDTGMLSGEDVMDFMGIPANKQDAYWRGLTQEGRDKLMSDFRSRGAGEPKVMYHGTARDITEFKPKQANAIFVTDRPRFAEGFADMSEDFMTKELADEIDNQPELKKQLITKAVDKAIKDKTLLTNKNSKGLYSTTREEHITSFLQRPLRRSIDAIAFGDFLNQELKNRLPSFGNIMPLYVRAENPFDYENENQVKQLVKFLRNNLDGSYVSTRDGFIPLKNLPEFISSGSWTTIETDDVQAAIKALGHDGFYVMEGGLKNLGVYDPNQIKSAIGNVGTFARDNNDIRYALALKGVKPDSALIPNEGGNPDGNLGLTPERLGGKPIRMLIGTHDDITGKGYGANHILNRVLNDPNRIPGGAEELLEKIVRTAQRTAQNYNSIYRDGGKFVLYDGKNSLVLSPEKGEMSIITMFTQENPQKRYGAPVWNGRAPRVAEFLQPVRGAQVVEREGRVARSEVPVQTKRVYTPEQIKDVETQPVQTSRKEGTLSLRKDAFKYSLRDSLGQDTVDAIERTTTAREEKGFAQRMGEALSPTGFAKFRQAFINKYEAIERLSKEVAQQFGSAELLADTSAIAATLFSDRAAGIAASSYQNGVPVFKDGFTTVSDKDGAVKGLIPILEPLMKYNDPFVFQAFQFYAATRRGKRLTAEGREQLFTAQDIQRGELIGQQYPEFKEVFDEYQKYNKGLVDFMRDTGVISEKEAEIWTQNWDYIPFYRQLEGEEIAGPNIFSSIAGVAKPRKLKGGEAPLADFMETIVRNSRAAIEAGMKNVAAQRVVRDVLRLNQGQFVPAALARGADIVTVKENGQTKHYQVDDPLLVEALKGLNLPQLPFLEVLAAPSNLLRNLVTKDPGFMLANLMRDSLQAWVTTGTNITPIVDTFKQYGAALAGKSKEAQALANAGLFAGYDFGDDAKSSARALEAELRKRTGTRTGKEIALLPISKMWDMLDKASGASDVATRAEVYKRTLAETGNEAEALYQAMEVLNFSRKGNSALIRVLTAVVPFMNARIQGLDVLYRSGFGKSATQNKERMQKAFITRSLTLMGLSWMYWMLASDTEEYKTAEQEVRDNYWIIGSARIPIPFEIGTVFKVFPERILEYFMGQDTSKDLKDSVIRNITSTLAINPIPQAILPAFENIANYSFFTGQPIVGKGLEDVAPKYQASAGTSLLAQQIGEATNYSPVKIDNLIRGYTGTLGTYAVMALDAIMRGEGDPTKATMKAEQLPVVKRFFASAESTGTVTSYYELKKAVDESTRTINFLERTGNMEDLREYMVDKGAKLQAVKPYIQSLDKDMTMLREMRRTVQMSNMDPDQKRNVLDNIRKAEVGLTSRIQFLKKSID